MIGHLAKITVIIRTIGARRGRAARGRPAAVFCFSKPVVDAARRDALMVAGEGVVQDGTVIWLHTPQGISNSRLAEKLGQVIGHVPTTARNLNTLRKLVEMLDA